MLTIINIKYIRELYFREGKSLSEIMKLTGRNYRTIKKYIEMEDFNEKEQPRKRTRKSDAIRPIIHQWLCEDRSRHHKQRHTAKRIYDRLKQEYPDLLQVCERTVRTLVKEEKTKVFETKDDAYLRLNHPGGQAQVDFGKVEIFEEGEKRSLHALVLSFPKSNAGFVQLTRSETREALLEGLQSMFSYLGYVPNTLWFDRMSSAAVQTRNEKGEVQLAEFVQRFATHYGFHVQFCNPNSGHEKGNVENKVGTLRRNLFVPEPEIKDLEQYNKELFQRCEQLNAQEHYLHKILKQQLLEEEKTQMIPFNPIAFDSARYEVRKVNKYGLVDYATCRYSARPQYVSQRVVLKITANRIDILSKDLSEHISSHPRLFGHGKESIHHVDFIDVLKHRPKAFKYSGIYDLLPEIWQQHLSSIDKKDYKETFDVLKTILLQEDMEFADNVLQSALAYQPLTPEKITVTYKRFKEPSDLYDACMPLKVDMPSLGTDIGAYDELMNLSPLESLKQEQSR